MVSRREVTDDDVRVAIKEMEGSLDISLHDFRDLYHYALRCLR